MATVLEQFREHTKISASNLDFLTASPEWGTFQDAVGQVDVAALIAKDDDFHDIVKKSGRSARKWADDYPNVPVETLAVDVFKLRLLLAAADRVQGFFHVQTNATNAFDVETTVDDALRLISLSEKVGLDSSRMVIRIVCTVEGLKACEQLHKRGVKTSAVGVCTLDQCAMVGKVGCKYAVLYLTPYLGTHPDNRQHDYALCFTAQDYYQKLGLETEVMVEGIDISPDAYLALAGLRHMAIPSCVLKDLYTVSMPIEDIYCFKHFAGVEYIGSDEIKFKNFADYQFKLFNFLKDTGKELTTYLVSLSITHFHRSQVKQSTTVLTMCPLTLATSLVLRRAREAGNYPGPFLREA